MTDDLERQLRERLQGLALPPAPEALREEVDRLTRDVPPGRKPRAVSGIAVLLAALGLIVLAAIGAGLSGIAAPSPSSSPSPASASPVASPPATSSPLVPSPPLGGLGDLRVYSVSELTAARAAGQIGGESVALRGYWSNRAFGHSCAPPGEHTGILELYCQDGEFGITERDEPIMTVLRSGDVILPSGPFLTPYIDEQANRDIAVWLFTLPVIADQPYPPVPIVTVGHFDDPRAADCRPKAQQLCRDRFVLDRLVSFEPEAVALPTPTPTPTPFPTADPPPAKYNASSCAGDVPYSFVGWTTLGSLGIDIGDVNAHVYVMITRDVMQVGDWTDGTGGRFRTMGQRVCYAYEWDEGVIGFAWMPGTAYREWADGHRMPLTP